MTLFDDIRRDMEAGSTGAWAYRPQQFDDWGVVRRAQVDADGWFHFICQVKTPMASDEALNEHRRNGTDPWEPDARRIARVPQLEQIALAAEGCANWCDVLIEVVLSTSCAPDDPEAFEDAIRGAQMFVAALRKAMEAAE